MADSIYMIEIALLLLIICVAVLCWQITKLLGTLNDLYIGHTMRDGFSSTKMREGLVHKFAYVVVLGVCLIIQALLNYYELPYYYGDACFSLAFVWICVTEVGSILENVVLLNPDLADRSFLHIFDKREIGRVPCHNSMRFRV